MQALSNQGADVFPRPNSQQQEQLSVATDKIMQLHIKMAQNANLPWKEPQRQRNFILCNMQPPNTAETSAEAAWFELLTVDSYTP
jgi:hypothetical protein